MIRGRNGSLIARRGFRRIERRNRRRRRSRPMIRLCRVRRSTGSQRTRSMRGLRSLAISTIGRCTDLDTGVVPSGCEDRDSRRWIVESIHRGTLRRCQEFSTWHRRMVHVRGNKWHTARWRHLHHGTRRVHGRRWGRLKINRSASRDFVRVAMRVECDTWWKRRPVWIRRAIGR